MAPPSIRKTALAAAVAAARAAGRVMCVNLRREKKVNVATHHDIKLELDVRCQKIIERTLQRAFPEISILGEEGIVGDPEALTRWVVDPIDGTVNFTYGIPHACVSIALQSRDPAQIGRSNLKSGKDGKVEESHFETLVGVVYDPFTDEMWTAIRGEKAKLNGIPIQVSRRQTVTEAIVALGFAKEKHTLEKMLPTLHRLIARVRKIRIMGAAALSLVYVGTGRMDGYIEYGLRLWDIAAGGLIVECAGGVFWRKPVAGDYAYKMVASNRPLSSDLRRLAKAG